MLQGVPVGVFDGLYIITSSEITSINRSLVMSVSVASHTSLVEPTHASANRFRTFYRGPTDDDLPSLILR